MTDPKARVVEILDQWFVETAAEPWPEVDLEQFADRLDAAGLLVKPWVSVKEPAEDGFYLVLLPEGRIRDFAFDIYGGWPDGATHYMKRPSPPKEPS